MRIEIVVCDWCKTVATMEYVDVNGTIRKVPPIRWRCSPASDRVSPDVDYCCGECQKRHEGGR